MLLFCFCFVPAFLTEVNGNDFERLGVGMCLLDCAGLFPHSHHCEPGTLRDSEMDKGRKLKEER